jgi:predicted Zn-dependent protease
MDNDPNGAGDIVITLTNDINPDGLSGFTKSTADGNQILKSTITIYNANQLSDTQLAAITRHEFGHAMGLAHSTAVEDLMHATIQTDYPYISQCDIDAVTGLYDGKKQSAVICQN